MHSIGLGAAVCITFGGMLWEVGGGGKRGLCRRLGGAEAHRNVKGIK